MIPLDYGRSFLIDKASTNEVRFWVESRSTATCSGAWQTGCGMTAGGSLSPLLAAVMLIPLDEARNRLFGRYGL